MSPSLPPLSHLPQVTNEGVASPKDVASAIIKKALELNSRDNMSAIVVALPGAPIPPPGKAEEFLRRQQEEASSIAGARS